MENWEDFTETQNVTIKPTEINKDNFDFVGRDVVVNKGVKTRFDFNAVNDKKKYKIKIRQSLEQEIDEERKRVTINTLMVGATVLATTLCAIQTGNQDLEFAQRLGSFLLTTISSKGLYDSVVILDHSVRRKIKLEDSYFDTYGEKYINEEKIGRKL